MEEKLHAVEENLINFVFPTRESIHYARACALKEESSFELNFTRNFIISLVTKLN